MATSRKITLRSSDGESFEVEQSVAVESMTIKHMIEDDCADNAIPLPNVNSKILAKVIEYCKKHVDVESTKAVDRVNEKLRAWDAEFVEVDEATVCDLMKAANYLSIKSLLDLTSQKGAKIVGGKIKRETLEILDEVRTIFLEKEEKLTSQREADIVARIIEGNTFKKILDEVMTIYGLKKEKKEEKETVRRILESKVEVFARQILLTLGPRGRKRKWGEIL